MTSENPLSKLLKLVSNSRKYLDLVRLLKNGHIVSLYSRGDFYDLAYKGYRGDTTFYSSLIGKHDKSLYLGTGTGRIFAKLANQCPLLLGVDYSPHMLKVMLKRFPQISRDRILIKDVFKLKMKPRTFDVIIAPFSFFTQFERAASLKLVRKLHSFLKKGGRLYADFYSPYSNPKNTELEIRRFNISSSKYFYKIYHYPKSEKKLNEYTVIYDAGNVVVLELKLFDYYPKDIRQIFSGGGFKKIKLTSGFSRSVKNTDLVTVYAVKN